MKPANPRILTINGGSSSIKFALFEAGESPRQGISPAVQSQEDNVEIKGLPFVKRDLNWVRIAQRFPVRIEIEIEDPAIFRMGTMAVTTIKGFTRPSGRN